MLSLSQKEVIKHSEHGGHLSELDGAAWELPRVSLIASRPLPPGEKEARCGPGDHVAYAYSDVIAAGYQHQVIRGMMKDSLRIQISMVTATINNTMYVSYQR